MRFQTRFIALVALIIGLVASASMTGFAQDGTPTSSPEAAMSIGAAYMEISNVGAEPDRLTGGSTAASMSVEIHEIVDEAGVMTMKPLTQGLEIPAAGAVTLEPGGYHVMLIGLTESLVDGSTYELTLTFERAGDVTIQVAVKADRDSDFATAIAPVTAGDITIANQWSRPAPMIGPDDSMPMAMAAGFMVITNTGAEADRLVSATTDASDSVEIHEMKEGEGGVIEMAPLADGLEIPAGGSVSLEPGGFHLMLIGIKQDFIPGFTYTITLTFESGVMITIPVIVSTEAPPAGAPIVAGSISITSPWSRPAPAMTGTDEMSGTPAAGM